MKKQLLSLLLSGVFFCTKAYQPENKPDNAWSRIKTPTLDIAEPIGSYANGCMNGAASLPASGEGFVDMRRNRNRYYGHPNLIRFITQLSQQTAANYNRKHLIGDLSQPRGGRMNFGHSSHQVGLDVDIWMQTVPKNASVNPFRDMRTIVNKARGTLTKKQIEKPTRDALYFAANYPQTARVFVNPIIKWHLCQTEPNTSWLRKLRPWWGHDQHFHVRLQCPADSANCKNQAPVAESDGCNDSLQNWVNEQSALVIGTIKPKPRSKKRRTVKIPPATCEQIRVK